MKEKQKDDYEVIIKRNGEVVSQTKTDCIMAAINDLEQKGTQVIIASSCPTKTIIETYIGLKDCEKKVREEAPELRLIEKMKDFFDSKK